MKKVLVIEDEKSMARFIELELRYEGFEVKTAFDGREGLDLALQEDWDMILLDLMLPGLNGIEVCRRIRNVKKTPVIMLTARDSVMDRVSGLDSGADDYIPKPFAIEELLARMRAILRRLEQREEGRTEDVLNFRDITMDISAQTVRRGDETVDLTKREFDLLAAFMKNMDHVLTREMLLKEVWESEVFIETNVIDVYVRYLRNKLDRPGEESIIQTVRGRGYVMRR